MAKTKLERVCVFCGSSPGHAPKHMTLAHGVGRALARRGIEIVYGGSPMGLMGAVADGALEAGGRVIGIIPDALSSREHVHHGLTELHVVRSMHLRKARMAELSDAFIALPGGLGTLDELFEIWTWAQIGLHAKPIGVLNADGYYGPLVTMVNHMAEEGFVPPAARALLRVDGSLDTLLDAFTTALGNGTICASDARAASSPGASQSPSVSATT